MSLYFEPHDKMEQDASQELDCPTSGKDLRLNECNWKGNFGGLSAGFGSCPKSMKTSRKLYPRSPVEPHSYAKLWTTRTFGEALDLYARHKRIHYANAATAEDVHSDTFYLDWKPMKKKICKDWTKALLYVRTCRFFYFVHLHLIES
jgi:hypothetical protein